MNLLKNVSVILLLFATSCVNNKSNSEFIKDGVSFTYPANWNIIEEEDLNGEGHYLAIEKKGLSNSGLVTITWTYNDVDNNIIKQEYLEVTKQELKSQSALKGLEFEPVKNSVFNGIESISCDFHFKTLDISNRGKIYVFSAGDKTFLVMKQESLEDISENENEFKLIESTFKVSQN